MSDARSPLLSLLSCLFSPLSSLPMKGRLNRRPTCRRLAVELLEPRQLLATGPLGPPPENVILLIGDGMGYEQVEAGRMFLGGQISFDAFVNRAEMTTFSASSPITDSAAAGTAMATGEKVDNRVISTALYNDERGPGDGSELTTLLEVLSDLGKATGLVTTTTITHATPAAFGAHAASRLDVADIAADLLGQTRPNVLLGGGGAGLTVEDAEAAGYTVVEDRDALLALDTDAETFVSGQFGIGYMPYEYDGLGDLPHLSDMAAAALDILDNDPDGFFLMIEGGRIDHAGHINDIQRNVRETAEFAATVQLVLDWAAGRADTLVLVTADHETGGLTVTGDNGPGLAPDVTWSTGNHTGVNVPVYAWGYKARYVSGVLDNTNLFSLATDGAMLALGDVDFVSRAGLDPSAGDLWFRARTTRRGLLTVEATSAAAATDTTAATDVVLTLYDRDLNPLAASTPVGGRPRIDWQTEAAVTYFVQLSGTDSDVTPSNNVDLQLANLVHLSDDGSRVNVYGTRGDDTFEVIAGSPLSAIVNGITYKFASATEVHVSGGAGIDAATVIGSAGIETASLYPNSGTVTGEGYRIELVGVSAIALEGGGGDDVVWLFGSPGSDQFVGAPGFGRLRGVTPGGNAFSNQARAFASVHADVSGEGEGNDSAKLYDSPGDDTLIARPDSVRLFGVTGSNADEFSIEALHFGSLHAYATAGGIDRAEFYDSPGNDLYVATPTHAALFNSSSSDDASSNDDSSSNDDAFYNRAKYFEQTEAFATAGGTDVTKFYDSSGNDHFLASGTYAALYNKTYRERYTNGFYHRARFFDGVHAYASSTENGAGGIDEARFYDSPQDDIFSADPIQAALFRTGEYYNRAKFFEGVHAFATAGGYDEARLFDSPGNDFFRADPDQGAMYRPGQYYNRARFFERVLAKANAGGSVTGSNNDEAYLQDSKSVDLLQAEDNVVRLSNAALDFLFEVEDFDYVKATATTVGDTLIAEELSFELDAVGIWNQP